MLVEASHTLQDPASGKTLYEAWKDWDIHKRKEAKDPTEVTDFNLADTRIGSGSDHTVFLNFVGMPTIGLQFDGDYGVYHSMYDDFYWMNHTGDPGYRYHTLMSQLWGVLALRLGNADLLPFDYASYAANVRQFAVDLTKGKDLGQLDLKPVMNGIDDFEVSARKLDESMAAALARGKLDPAWAAKINRGLMQAERNWLNPDGIPGRPWFKHILYGARFTYAHLELPGLTEAVEKGDWATAKQQAEILRQALAKNTELMDQLNADLTTGKN